MVHKNPSRPLQPRPMVNQKSEQFSAAWEQIRLRSIVSNPTRYGVDPPTVDMIKNLQQSSSERRSRKRQSASQMERQSAMTRSERVALDRSAPPWWAMPDTARAAAKNFDQRHDQLCGRLDELCLTLRASPSEERLDRSFHAALFEVKTNRYFAPPLTPDRPRRPRRLPALAAPVPVEAFDVLKSIWAPRAAEADARALYDTDEVEEIRFSNDWDALLDLGLSRYVGTYDDDGGVDDDNDGVPDEVSPSPSPSPSPALTPHLSLVLPRPRPHPSPPPSPLTRSRRSAWCCGPTTS